MILITMLLLFMVPILFFGFGLAVFIAVTRAFVRMLEFKVGKK